MAGFSWTFGTLALLLIAGNCAAAVNQNHLAQLVNEIWEKSDNKRMFSLAASIPQMKNKDQQYDASQVFSDANMEAVKTTLAKKEMYTNGRLVAARPLMKKGQTHVHAEYRVLTHFDTLLNNNYDKDHDLLLFYVLQSPCYYQCTKEGDELNILKHLHLIRKWKHYAFVFTDIFIARNVPTTEEDLRQSLERIGIKYGLGLRNIFRCTKSGNHMQCSSCSAGNQVAQYCVSKEEPYPNQRQPSISVPGNNVNEKATASSSQGGLENSNRNDVSTGGRDNGRGNGMSRRRGGRKRRGKGKGGRKRGRQGKQNRHKGGRRRKKGNKRGGKRKRRPNGRRG